MFFPRWLRYVGGLFLSLSILLGLIIFVARASNDPNACLVATDSLHVTRTLDLRTGLVYASDPIPSGLMMPMGRTWQSPAGNLYSEYTAFSSQQIYLARTDAKTRRVRMAALQGKLRNIYGWSADSQYLAAGELDGSGQIGVGVFAEPDLRRIPLFPLAGLPYTPLAGIGGWSAQGHEFVYRGIVNNTTYLVSINADTGVIQAAPIVLTPVSQSLWSPDSQYAAVYDDTVLAVYNLETHSAQTVTNSAKFWLNSVPLVGWLGHTLYYLDRSEDNNHRIIAFNADDGSVSSLLIGGNYSFVSFAPDMGHAIVARQMPEGSSVVLIFDFHQATATEIIKDQTLAEVTWHDNGLSAILRFRDSFMWMKADGSRRYQVGYRIGDQRTPDNLVVFDNKVAFRTDEGHDLRIGVLDTDNGEVRLFKRGYPLRFVMSPSPDGKWLALFFPIVEDHAGIQLTLLAMDDTKSWDLPIGSGVEGDLVWASDSSKIAFYTEGIGTHSVLQILGLDGTVFHSYDKLPTRFFPQRWSACS